MKMKELQVETIGTFEVRILSDEDGYVVSYSKDGTRLETREYGLDDDERDFAFRDFRLICSVLKNAQDRRHEASCMHGDCWCKAGSDGT